MMKEYKIIRVAVLAEEPIGWGSGKHYFPIILDNYTWDIKNKSYKFITKYIYDKDILKGKLNKEEFDVFLIPGGGVGDGESIVKGFNIFPKVKKWKKNVSTFVKEGGGIIGICGGAALITDLKTENKKPITFLERQYNKSSIGISCVSSYYKTFAFPLFYLFQKKYPEKIGASAYVFSFSPGETKDGTRFYAAGAPIDFQIYKNHPIFSDFKYDNERIHWWGGPALVLPEKLDRDVKILAKYPVNDLSENNSLKIYAWRYIGGIYGLFLAFFKSLKLIKIEKLSLKNVFLYTFFLAGNWELTNKKIVLDYSNRPSITAEIYPNGKKGRIILCTSHPEYMIWWNGHIEEVDNSRFNSIGKGFHKWIDISPLSNNIEKELTYTWWLVRRFVAWTAKIPDDEFPPIQSDKINEKIKLFISENVFWNGSFVSQMKNI